MFAQIKNNNMVIFQHKHKKVGSIFFLRFHYGSLYASIEFQWVKYKIWKKISIIKVGNK